MNLQQLSNPGLFWEAVPDEIRAASHLSSLWEWFGSRWSNPQVFPSPFV